MTARYYSLEYKKMCEVLSIDFLNNSFYILSASGSPIAITGLDKLMWSFGLTDINGKLIFENDILNIGQHNGEPVYGLVRLQQGSFFVVPTVESFEITGAQFSSCEKIGTVYEVFDLVKSIRAFFDVFFDVKIKYRF